MTTPQFAIFDHIEAIPGTPTSQLFKDRLALIRTADEAGFAGYHLAEHHGGGLCMAPSQEVFIAAASQVTEQIRLGPMVKLLPMHNPVRIIEDMCVLDQLTEGRLEFGVGRGAVPIEHTWFGDDWHESRERFTDVLGSSSGRCAVVRCPPRTAASTTSRRCRFRPSPIRSGSRSGTRGARRPPAATA
jgi:Luciferase-like monooxygenase